MNERLREKGMVGGKKHGFLGGQKHRPETEWEKHLDTHPPLITPRSRGESEPDCDTSASVNVEGLRTFSRESWSAPSVGSTMLDHGPAASTCTDA